MSDQIVRSYDKLDVDVDMVLRGQGADPAVIRQRRPCLVALARQALVEGMQYKSFSMLLGISPFSFSAGRPCDFCSLNETCRYQKHDTRFSGHSAIL